MDCSRPDQLRESGISFDHRAGVSVGRLPQGSLGACEISSGYTTGQKSMFEKRFSKARGNFYASSTSSHCHNYLDWASGMSADA